MLTLFLRLRIVRAVLEQRVDLCRWPAWILLVSPLDLTFVSPMFRHICALLGAAAFSCCLLTFACQVRAFV